MKEVETSGIDREHILMNPIVNSYLKMERMGHLTHEQAMYGMVNALADRNAELEKKIMDFYNNIPMPPKKLREFPPKK